VLDRDVIIVGATELYLAAAGQQRERIVTSSMSFRTTQKPPRRPSGAATGDPVA
jgi:hypothetical protein